MLHRFFGLRLDAVVAGNNEHDHIGRLCTARAHGTKCRVPRRVEEANHAVIGVYVISTYVLSNAARFVRGNGRLADIVQQ